MSALEQSTLDPVVARVDENNRAQISLDAELLAKELQKHTQRIFPPVAQKAIRRFSSAEAANFLGIHEGYLRQLAVDGKAPLPEIQPNGKRTFSVDEITAVREFLDGNQSNRRYIPHRMAGEKLQILSVINFKGGSAKTTTAAHLSQYLALRGYRVLAIDLDPQASLSTLFGQQPELDVLPNETLYGALRYDNERTSIEEIIRATYLPGLHFIPGNLELMEFETTTPVAKEVRSFFLRIFQALQPVESEYDVVVMDCPPNLGYLTMAALSAATSLLVTVHPQMLDVLSMAQFLKMVGDTVNLFGDRRPDYDWLRYLITRYEPNDGPQNQMVTWMRSLFEHRVLQNPVLKSTAIADSGLTKQTLYEVDRTKFTKSTYDRALESLDLVNGEIEANIRRAWGRQ
ncbi:plasmid partitioning protein RepA (plasmid) [Microvirga ossetica]|uniref:Plasmid partitioning protein RepA n=1 Tax=Microvirga ossetica TaxID=1882682 RepID=A0A1B2EQ82_9HYPH|nr:plasmid partitioning protein RepA [Microvirga ossetica]ANY82131.1 plasmid partitioning protein RepA [Microvirga ossetica]